MKYVLMGLIRIYQWTLSPLLGPVCRYYPSCSHYGYEAIAVHGAAKGSVLAAWRVLRCNPWSAGGVDPVPARGRWRPPADDRAAEDRDPADDDGLGGAACHRHPTAGTSAPAGRLTYKVRRGGTEPRRGPTPRLGSTSSPPILPLGPSVQGGPPPLGPSVQGGLPAQGA